ncbi:hypothetical protein WDV76_06610 [Xenorhabdus griffiniae]|uniref:hypothetical protein n=1 Tax=Xenorhabdus griffiniae TaxID=351672 RepID=UPI0030D32B92
MSITKMREDEVDQLLKGLLKHGEPYRQQNQIAPEKPIARRKTQRDKGANGMLPKSLEKRT